MSVLEWLLTLQVKQGGSTIFEVTLQLNQCRDVLVVDPQVVQQGQCLLAVHAGLYRLVANVEGMLAKAVRSDLKINLHALNLTEPCFDDFGFTRVVQIKGLLHLS